LEATPIRRSPPVAPPTGPRASLVGGPIGATPTWRSPPVAPPTGPRAPLVGGPIGGDSEPEVAAGGASYRASGLTRRRPHRGRLRTGGRGRWRLLPDLGPRSSEAPLGATPNRRSPPVAPPTGPRAPLVGGPIGGDSDPEVAAGGASYRASGLTRRRPHWGRLRTGGRGRWRLLPGLGPHSSEAPSGRLRPTEVRGAPPPNLPA